MSKRPLHWWQWLLPTYGNWGGPGWSGGEYTDDPASTRWDMEPVDRMDACFQRHDYMYQLTEYPELGDINLLIDLAECPVSGWYSRAYRVGAIVLFGCKVIASVWWFILWRDRNGNE